jgi:threonine aldolase
MRQAGVLAAAGIVALDYMVDRLSEDHIRAKRLANGLRKIPGLALDEGGPQTNMVFFSLTEDTHFGIGQVISELKSRRVLVGAAGQNRIRMVTHCWITDEDIEKTLAVFGDVFSKG